MKKIFFMMSAPLAMICCQISAAPAFAAHPGAVASAVDSINSFYTDSELIAKDFIHKDLKDSSAVRRDAAIKEIKSVEWTEEPSERRNARLRAIVEGYMTERIHSIIKETEKEADIEGLSNKLNALMDENLIRLEKALKSEVREKKEIKPVPIIDRPPQESPAPDEAPGIWYR